MTIWYAQNSSVNIDSANEWNDAANGSGNWLTWPPAAGDTLRANGKTAIAINVDFTCAQIDTVTSGGGFAISDARTITANIQGGTVHCITTSGSGYTLTINGNVSGSTSTDDVYTILNAVAVNITVNGNVVGGSNSNRRGIRNTSTGAIVVVGDVTGGSGTNSYGIDNTSTGTVTVTGSVVGGTAGSNSHGINAGGAGAVSITGNVTGGSSSSGASGVGGTSANVTVTGTVTGGSAANCHAVLLTNTGTATINGSIVDTASAQAVYARKLIFNPSATQYWRAQAPGSTTKDYYYDVPAAGNVTEDDTTAGVTGTYHEATEAEVQSGVTFGASQGLTGTYEGAGGGLLINPGMSGGLR